MGPDFGPLVVQSLYTLYRILRIPTGKAKGPVVPNLRTQERLGVFRANLEANWYLQIGFRGRGNLDIALFRGLATPLLIGIHEPSSTLNPLNPKPSTLNPKPCRLQGL